MKNSDSPNYKELFDEFGVKDENELHDKLMNEAFIFTCCVCGKEYPFESMKFMEEKVVCQNCSVEDDYE